MAKKCPSLFHIKGRLLSYKSLSFVSSILSLQTVWILAVWIQSKVQIMNEHLNRELVFQLCFLPGALALLIACRKHYKCRKTGPWNIDQLLHFWLSKIFTLISFTNSIYCHSGLAFQLWSSITASTHHLELVVAAEPNRFDLHLDFPILHKLFRTCTQKRNAISYAGQSQLKVSKRLRKVYPSHPELWFEVDGTSDMLLRMPLTYHLMSQYSFHPIVSRWFINAYQHLPFCH